MTESLAQVHKIGSKLKRGLVTNTGDTAVSSELLENPDLDLVFITERRFRDNYPEGTRLIFVDSLNDPAKSTQQAVAAMDLSDREFVISLSERAALTAAYLRSYLGIRGSDIVQTLNCTNKYTMKRRFQSVGLLVAEFSLCGSSAQLAASARRVGLPAIVKPVMSAGADAIFVINGGEDLVGPLLSAFANRLLNPSTTSEKEFPVIVEQFLDVTAEYHCDGYVAEGEIRYARVSRYIRPVLDYEGQIHGSVTLPNSDPRAISVLQMHELAVRATGLRDSLTHFEVLEADGNLYAGEIAARAGGGGIRGMLKLRDGFDSRDALVAISVGEIYAWQTSDTSDLEYAEILLPAQRGRIIELTPMSSFLSLPNVLKAEPHLAVGDIVGGLTDSSTFSAIIYAQLANADEVAEVVDQVAGLFNIRTASVEPDGPLKR